MKSPTSKPEKPEFAACPVGGFRIQLPCELESVRAAAEALTGYLTGSGVKAEEASLLQIAVVEALNNAVIHVGEGDRDQPIVLTASLPGDGVLLQVFDHTSGFDLPAHAELPGDESVGGRGIFLMQSAVDEVDYLRGRRRNCLTLFKRLDLVPAGSPGVARVAEVEAELAAMEEMVLAMTEELSSCYESLAAIYEFSRELGAVQDSQVFAGNVMGHLLRITNSDWFVCRLYDAESKTLDTLVQARAFEGAPTVDLGKETDREFVEAAAVRTRKDQWFGGEQSLNPADPLNAFGSSLSGVAHACHIEEQLVGTVAVGSLDSDRVLSSGEVNMLHTFADFLMIHLLNRRYQEATVRTQLLEGELKIANRIQTSLYPSRLPELGGLRVSGWTRSAREVGGDFFDVLQCGEEGLLLVIADVMGKGIPAALFAVVLRSVIRAVPQLWDSPGQLMTHVNHVLYQDLSRTETFITAQFVFANPTTRRISHANAGHWPALASVREGSDVRLDSLENDDMPLGLLEANEFGEATYQLLPGHRVILFSDGIVEARNPSCELFGDDRLKEWLKASCNERQSVMGMRQSLVNELMEYEGPVDQSDDQTLLVLSFEAEES